MTIENATAQLEDLRDGARTVVPFGQIGVDLAAGQADTDHPVPRAPSRAATYRCPTIRPNRPRSTSSSVSKTPRS
jgi:hypothetical protein